MGGTYPAPVQVIDLSAYSSHAANYQAVRGPLGLAFDATDDRLSFGVNLVNARLSGAKGIGVAVYVRPLGLVSGTGRNQLFSFNVNGSSSSVSAWFTDSGKLVFGGRSQSADSFQSYTTLSAVASDEKDVFICGILDFAADRLRIWIGDKLAAEQSVTFTSDTYQPGTATQADTLGASAVGMYPLNGIVRGFALFRKPLDADEVQAVRRLME